RSRGRGNSPECELTERRLIALAEQLEDVRALREVVMRELRPMRLLANEAADAEELSPVGRRRLRIESRPARLEAMLGFVDAAGRHHRFARREVGLNGISWRHA